jgi:PadR family transcriptional regulator, regulatory protein PadR
MGQRTELMPGTLGMLILKTLTLGPLHGYGIAQHIRQVSDTVLSVEEGSLYPALQRLLVQGLVKSEWKQSETNRRARYYSLTPAGKKELGLQVSQFEELVAAIGRVLQTT